MRRLCWALPLALLCSCTNHDKKMQERVKNRETAKDTYEKKEEEKRKAAIPKVEPAKLDPPWEAADYLHVTSGKPCPEGVWAMFSTAPGEGDEQKANEGKRKELLGKVKGATYVTTLNVDTGVKVQPYSEKKKVLSIEIEGLVECTDGVGMVSMAWGEPAKVLRPKKGDPDDPTPPQSVWRAKPITFPVPFDTKEEASAFVEGPGAGLQVRLVYRIKKTQEDKHLVKTELGKIDYGAGRLMHVELVGARLSTDHEKVAVIEKKYKE